MCSPTSASSFPFVWLLFLLMDPLKFKEELLITDRGLELERPRAGDGCLWLVEVDEMGGT